VADVLDAAFLHEDVDVVDGPRIVVVQPGVDDMQPAVIPAMLVGDDIVRIVGARSEIAGRPNRFPGQGKRCGGAILAFGCLRHFAQNLLDIGPHHGTLLAEHPRDVHVLANLQLIRLEINDVVIGHVIAHGVE
jgi:hypothetical protein